MHDLSTRLTNRNPICTVCGKADKRCKELAPRLQACWNGREPEHKPHTDTYKYLRPLDGNMGGLWLDPDPDYKKQLPGKPKGATVASKEEPTEKTEPSLSDELLDANYRKILASATLAEKHQNKLAGRANIEELYRYGFRTWYAGAVFDTIDMPGVRRGRAYGHNGIFLPIYTPWNHLIGGQLAPDNKRAAKYVYIKGATQARANKGHLLAYAYGLPACPTERDIEAATLQLSVRGRHVCAELNGVRVAQHYPTQSYRAERALMLGLQLALTTGVQNLTIAGYKDEADETLQYRTVRTIVNDLLDRQGAVRYTDTPVTPFDVTEEALDAGKQFLDTNTVGLCDGVAKAKYAALKHTQLFIGCPGSAHSTNKADLLAYLTAIAPTEVIDYPDAGDVLNTVNIPHAHRALHRTLDEAGYNVSVGWWGQLEKVADNDIDDLPEGTEIEKISTDDYFELHPLATKESVDKDRAFYRTGIHEVSTPFQSPHAPHEKTPFIFQKGQRVYTLQSVLAQHKFVHDKSFPGSGKSFTFEFLKLSDIHENCRRIIHVTNDVVSTHATQYAEHRGRDNGRVLNATDGKIVRAKLGTPEDQLTHAANCKKAEQNEFLLDHGLAPTQQNLNCKKCPFYQECKSTPGNYLYDRKEAQKKTHIRMHSNALDTHWIKGLDGKAWDKSDAKIANTAVILDDVSPWTEAVKVSYADIEAFLEEHTLSAHLSLRNLLCQLKELCFLRDEKGHYLKQQNKEIKAALPALNLNPTDIWRIETDEHDAIIQHYERGLKDKAPKAWIGSLIRAINENGILQIIDSELRITNKNKRFFNTINHPGIGWVVIGDATIPTEYLQLWFGGIDIPCVAQQLPKKVANAHYTQIATCGDVGYTRNEALQAKVAAIKAHTRKKYDNLAIVDIKSATKDTDEMALIHRGSARGSNVAKNVDAILVTGTPRANIDAKLAEYLLLTGKEEIDCSTVFNPYPVQYANREGHFVSVKRAPKDAGFARYLHDDTSAELIQAFNRARQNCRPDDSIDFIFFSEYPLDWAVNVVTPEEYLEDKTEAKFRYRAKQTTLTEREVLKAANTLKRKNFLLTQAALAAVTEVSAKTVHYFFTKPGRDWRAFVEYYKTAETLTTTEVGISSASESSNLDFSYISNSNKDAELLPTSGGVSVSASDSTLEPATERASVATLPKPHPYPLGSLANYACEDGQTRYGFFEYYGGRYVVVELAGDGVFPVRC